MGMGVGEGTQFPAARAEAPLDCTLSQYAALAARGSPATVAKYTVRRRRPPSRTWRTLRANHVTQMMATDFFVVPSIAYRLLFVLVILRTIGGASCPSRSPRISRPPGPRNNSARPFQQDHRPSFSPPRSGWRVRRRRSHGRGSGDPYERRAASSRVHRIAREPAGVWGVLVNGSSKDACGSRNVSFGRVSPITSPFPTFVPVVVPQPNRTITKA
jgi:hypothetical protein